MKMAVLKIQGSNRPDYVERDTVFKIDQKIAIEYDWAEKENCMNGYRNNWHKDTGIFIVKDIICNMIINPSEIMIKLHSDNETFIKRCNRKEFYVFENLLIGRLCN